MEKHIVKHAHFKERVIFDEGIFLPWYVLPPLRGFLRNYQSPKVIVHDLAKEY